MPLCGHPNIEKLRAKYDLDGLLKALEYRRDARIRCAAALALGELKVLTAIEPLMVMQKEPDAETRDAASRALTLIRDSLLAGILKGDCGDAALVALERLGTPAGQALLDALGSADGKNRKAIIAALGKRKEDRAVDILLGLLNDSDAAVRLEAVHALESIADPRTVDPLAAKLTTRDLGMRKAVIHALDALDWSPSADSQGAVFLVSLRRWQDCIHLGTPAVPALLEALQDKPSVRLDVIRVLGEIADDRAVEPLIALLKDEDHVVREKAVHALGGLAGSRAAEGLCAALKDRRTEVAQVAAIALGQRGDESAVGPLITALQAAMYPLRGTLGDALSRIGKPAVEPLVALLQNGTDEVRIISEDALVKIGEPSVLPLIESLKGEQEKSRAFSALGRIGDPRAVEPLLSALCAPAPGIHRAAVHALDQLGWKPAADELGAWYWASKTGWEQCVQIGEKAVEPLLAMLTDDRCFTAARALRELYRAGTLDQAAKERILQVRDQLTRQHEDHHEDKIIDDEVFMECFGEYLHVNNHDDHIDDVDFPL